MTLPTKTIPGFASDMSAAWAARVGITPAFSDGDVLLALWLSVATQLDFLQAQAEVVLNLTRSQTSTGGDLDSWMAQFDFARLAATQASGEVTFTKLTAAANQILIPVGTIVQTSGGAIQYQVIADTAQSAYSAEADAYVLAPGQTSLTATVQAVVGGSASNVAAGQLVQMGTSVPGIDSVTNGASINNGIDAESDADFRDRFILYLATLAKATKQAILAAAMSVQQGLEVTLLENQRPNGTTLLGSFTAIIDDGSGAPPNSLLDKVKQAIDATRAFSVQAFVVGPTTINVTIGITIRLAENVSSAAVIAAVRQNIINAVNDLAAGETLYVSAIDAAALATPGVLAVRPGTIINGSGSDLTPSTSQEVRTTLGSVTASTY